MLQPEVTKIKLVTGGQTGVDRAVMDVALKHGWPLGGWCPKGRRAEDGPIAPHYPLEECDAETYEVRTKLNVQDSDGTLVLLPGDVMSPGTQLTIEFATSINKLWMVQVIGPEAMIIGVWQWVKEHQIRVLNIAGPRESEYSGIYEKASAWLTAFLLTT